MATQVETLTVGPFEVNCYIVWNKDTRDGVIIDPGAEGARIAATVKSLGVKILGILLTHGHVDHIGAVTELKELYRVGLWTGDGEETLLLDPIANASAFLDEPVTTPPPDHKLIDEDVVSLGGIRLAVLSTPGHTKAGVCYLEESDGLLFCGDTLFMGSIGRTDLLGGSTEVLLESIHSKILTLPDGIVCYPGHGPRTTVGAERVNNPFLTGADFA
ncbi:MAG TPA: MBL fold metallo-hydrolase [Candidatus Acidoferrum sp.]|nr:MBL fold metallo-hydrolase [Candidatus Acidoferrum sp.]